MQFEFRLFQACIPIVKVWSHPWPLLSLFDCFIRVLVCLSKINLPSFEILKQYISSLAKSGLESDKSLSGYIRDILGVLSYFFHDIFIPSIWNTHLCMLKTPFCVEVNWGEESCFAKWHFLTILEIIACFTHALFLFSPPFFVNSPNELTKIKIAILIWVDFLGEIQLKINISVRASHEILVVSHFHSSTPPGTASAHIPCG